MGTCVSKSTPQLVSPSSAVGSYDREWKLTLPMSEDKSEESKLRELDRWIQGFDYASINKRLDPCPSLVFVNVQCELMSGLSRLLSPPIPPPSPLPTTDRHAPDRSFVSHLRPIAELDPLCSIVPTRSVGVADQKVQKVGILLDSNIPRENQIIQALREVERLLSVPCRYSGGFRLVNESSGKYRLIVGLPESPAIRKKIVESLRSMGGKRLTVSMIVDRWDSYRYRIIGTIIDRIDDRVVDHV